MLSVTSSLTRLTTNSPLHHPNPNSTLIAPIPKSNHVALPLRFRSGIKFASKWIRSVINGSELSSEPNDFAAITVPKRVVLVRHGQSTWNAEGRIQGSSNFSVLTEKGESQAEVSRQMLAADQFDVCFASPLNRSKRTAEVIWGSRKEKIITDYDLREIDLYSFQGLLKHEGKSKFGDAYSHWQTDASNFYIDGHYPVRELWSRARSCWKKVLAYDGRSVLVVAHNAVNQALIGTALGLGPEYFRVLVQSNCGVSALDFSPSSEGSPPYVCLNRLNQTPKSPLAESGGRKANKRMVLVSIGSGSCINEGIYESHPEGKNLDAELSQKVAELLSDVNMTSIISSPGAVCTEAAAVISNVQKASYSGTSNLVMKQSQDLDSENIAEQSIKLGQKWFATLNSKIVTKLWDQSGQAWPYLLSELSYESQLENVVVAVAPPLSHIALLGRCLNLTKEQLSLFHLDSGSVTVIDFPDGPAKQGVVKCTNYTAHLGKWAAPISKSSLHNVEL
uniref:2-carboxy-D-arabinitol-1-phosphatase n=1 Tax=Kalanchoe fedtschenkoi TaxID=63787 RepID=A0A7N0TMP1_KALFE